MPDTVSPEFALWGIPPDPGFPAEMHGAPVVMVAGLYAGPAQEGLEVLAPLARLGTPLVDATAITDYVTSQSGSDPLFPAGARYFFKSHFLETFDDDAAAAVLAAGAARPTPQSLVIVRTMGGAIARVGDDESAFAHRRARFNVSIDAGWTDPATDAAAIGWARRSWDCADARSPPAGCTSTSPASTRTPTATRSSGPTPGASTRSPGPTTRTASSPRPPPGTEPGTEPATEPARRHAKGTFDRLERSKVPFARDRAAYPCRGGGMTLPAGTMFWLVRNRLSGS